MYIADRYNNRVRLWNASTRVVTTIVGTGAFGFSGDGGPATSAMLAFPSGLAVDAAGNVVIADSYNYRVRLWTKSTGIITTIAGTGSPIFGGDGGPGTLATMSVSGVALNAAGDVFIADTQHNRVRRWTRSTATVTTVVGTGGSTFAGDGGAGTAARLQSPQAVAVDASGNVFIADVGNNRVRVWSASTRSITTIAGNGARGFSGDGGAGTSAAIRINTGVAVDASGNVFFTDPYAQCVRLWTASTGVLTTIVGIPTAGGGFSGDGGPGTSAAVIFADGEGIAVDSAGNAYISANNRVRLWTRSTGVVTSIAGTGAGGFGGDGGPGSSAAFSSNGPRGVAVDVAGNVVIADTDNHRVRLWTRATDVVTTIAGSGASYRTYAGDGGQATNAVLTLPTSVAVDAAGEVFIFDQYNYCIFAVTKSTGIINNIVGTGAQGLDGSEGRLTGAGVGLLVGIAVGASGNVLVVAEAANNRIRMLLAATPVPTAPTTLSSQTPLPTPSLGAARTVVAAAPGAAAAGAPVSAAAVAGGVVGGAFGCAAVALLVLVVARRRVAPLAAADAAATATASGAALTRGVQNPIRTASQRASGGYDDSDSH